MFIITRDGETAINTDKIIRISVKDASDDDFEGILPKDIKYIVVARISIEGTIGSESTRLDARVLILNAFRDKYSAMEYLKDIVEKIQGKAVYI